jgi:hypothetical protein
MLKIPTSDSLDLQDEALRMFVKESSTFLAEFIRLDGRGASTCVKCPFCGIGDPVIRCSDCIGGALACRTCCVNMHRYNPLHRIEVRFPHIERSLIGC